MKRRVLTGLIVLNLVFIWGNSAMPGEASSEVSGGILEWLTGLFLFLAADWAHNLIRKLAHFSEFALLGVLMGWRYRLEKGSITPVLACAGLAVACVDETIQIFSPGRASSLLDVWLDTAGFTVGLALLALVTMLRNKRKSGT